VAVAGSRFGDVQHFSRLIAPEAESESGAWKFSAHSVWDGVERGVMAQSAKDSKKKFAGEFTREWGDFSRAD